MVLNTHFIKISDFIYIEEWEIGNGKTAKLYSQEHENNPDLPMDLSSTVLKTNIVNDEYTIHLDYEKLVKTAAINEEPLSTYVEPYLTTIKECDLCEDTKTRYSFLAEKSVLSMKLFMNVPICPDCLDSHNPEELISPEDRSEIVVSRI